MYLHTTDPTFCRFHACYQPQQQIHDRRSTKMVQNAIEKLLSRLQKLYNLQKKQSKTWTSDLGIWTSNSRNSIVHGRVEPGAPKEHQS